MLTLIFNPLGFAISDINGINDLLLPGHRNASKNRPAVVANDDQLLRVYEGPPIRILRTAGGTYGSPPEIFTSVDTHAGDPSGKIKGLKIRIISYASCMKAIIFVRVMK